MPPRAGSKQAFQRRVEALEALRGSSDRRGVREQLAKALRDPNGFFVARAVSILTELRLEELVPELLGAFDRFFDDPTKSDPQCLAKTAIARTLRELGHRDAEPFLRGLTYVQLEPTWGGRADTAADLRGACALALTETNLGDLEILSHLTDGLADPDRTVRTNTARAIEQLGRQEGALLLRLKLLVGDREPDVLGQCFSSYLSLAPEGGAVSFIARFLRSESDDVRLEAASALAQCRDPRAIEILIDFWSNAPMSQEMRRALLINLGASPLREAAEFLLTVIEQGSVDLAVCAVTALATGRYRTELQLRVSATVGARDSSQLTEAFGREFSMSVRAG
jgi:HEAT repeat protein